MARYCLKICAENKNDATELDYCDSYNRTWIRVFLDDKSYKNQKDAQIRKSSARISCQIRKWLCDVKDGDEILIQVKDVWDSLLLAETIEAVANYGLHVTVLANLYVKGKIAQWTYYQPWENANEHADYRRVIVSH